jgi:hypothetical protein
LIEQAAPFPPRLRTVDQPATLQPVPAEIREVPPYQATVVLTGHQPSERRAVLVHDR